MRDVKEVVETEPRLGAHRAVYLDADNGPGLGVIHVKRWSPAHEAYAKMILPSLSEQRMEWQVRSAVWKTILEDEDE